MGAQTVNLDGSEHSIADSLVNPPIKPRTYLTRTITFSVADHDGKLALSTVWVSV